MNEQMNILLEVLEEIKQQNRELKASITNLVSQPNPATNSSEDDAISLMDVARLIGQKIETDGKFKSELTDVAIVLGKRIREIKDSIAKNQERQAKSIASLSEKIQETQSPPEIKKYYLFDVKRWIEWLIWGISIVLIACTIGCTVYLHSANQTLESYALRYRILRMEHSVSNTSFAQLDSIFEIHRSNEAIATLEQRVINHEAAVRRQVELAIQQQLITAEQAELQQQLNL